LGGLTGLLVGLGTLAIPGIGPIMLAGATATALATTLAGAGIGAAAGGLLGGLIGLGIPEERAREYNRRVERGHYLVIVDGTDAEIARAERMLREGGIEDYDIYDYPNSATPAYMAGGPVTGVGTGLTDPVMGVSTGVPEPVMGVSTGVPMGTTMHKRQRAIGVFDHRRDAEAALMALRDAGFSMNNVSLIGKDVSGHNQIADIKTNPVTNTKADEGAKTGAATGAALGGLGGLLVGLGALAIPGIGPVIAGGAVATALATALTGGAVGAAAGGLAGGLVGLGIPENRAKAYSDRFNRGDYLVMVDGTDAELRQAESILKRYNIEDYNTFDAADDRSRNLGHAADLDQSRTNYATGSDRDDPAVIIIDRRDEVVER
jgi:hypothetical protein